MPTIYDLDNEGGGQILTDSDSGPALQINSNAAGQPAISILSTASGSPLKATVINSSIDIDSISASAVAAVDIRSGASIQPAIVVGRTVRGSLTIAAMKFLGTSVASGSLMQFEGGYVSLTSIKLGDGGAADYALPITVGGEVRYIPLVKAADLIGGATF